MTFFGKHPYEGVGLSHLKELGSLKCLLSDPDPGPPSSVGIGLMRRVTSMENWEKKEGKVDLKCVFNPPFDGHIPHGTSCRRGGRLGPGAGP